MEISAGMRSSLNEDEWISADEEYSGIIGGMEEQYVTSIKKCLHLQSRACIFNNMYSQEKQTIAYWHYSLGATRILYYFSCCESAVFYLHIIQSLPNILIWILGVPPKPRAHP